MGPPARIALPRVRRTPPGQGSCTRGCGRRARRRCAAPAATPCGRARPASRPSGRRRARGVYGWSHLSARQAAVCGAPRSGLSSTGHSPAATRSISAADPDHGVDEAVDLGEVLALGGLHHQRARHRERHRRRVQAVVGQPLGDVVDRHAGRLRDPPQVEDALVGHPARPPPRRAPGSARASRVRDVVGRRDGRERGPAQPVDPHQPQVRPRDRQHARAAVRRRRHGAPTTPAARAGTAPGARPPRPGPRPGRRRRAGCRTSCAG